jgi:hypothetical protein
MAMDWDAAVEKNREALTRIVASLVAMAGLTGLYAPVKTSARRSDDGGSPGKAEAEPGPTLPRRLYRAVLALLRPAEAAVRRLLVVAARDITVPTPPPRKVTPKRPKLRTYADGSMLVPRFLRTPPPKPPRPAPRRIAFQLADTLRGLSYFKPQRIPTRSLPRIRSFDEPFIRRPVPSPPMPDDPIDARRLLLRLEALGRVLGDLPREAKRLARWQARCDARQIRRSSPMRPGRAPGWRKKPKHEVHQVLTNLHGLAFWSDQEKHKQKMQRRDSS